MREIDGLRQAGRATARLLSELADLVRPGLRTAELDAHAAAYIERIGAEPVFHTQNGFPGCINTSVNDEAVHGIPGARILEAGDLLSIDCGMLLDGYCGDATITVGVGPENALAEKRRRIRDVAREALRRGIGRARAGGRVGDIGYAMQSYVESQGFHLLRQYTGHGLGQRLWEEPQVPSVGRPGTGPRLVDGLVITLEPIVTAGRPDVYVDADGWTVRTRDGEPVAQFEHTVMVTRHGARILTAA